MAEKFKHLFASRTGLVFFVFQASEGKREAGVEREIRGMGEGVVKKGVFYLTLE